MLKILIYLINSLSLSRFLLTLKDFKILNHFFILLMRSCKLKIIFF